MTEQAEKEHRFGLRVPHKPVDLWERLARLAKSNRRSVQQEVIVAIEDRLITAGLLTPEECER